MSRHRSPEKTCEVANNGKHQPTVNLRWNRRRLSAVSQLWSIKSEFPRLFGKQVKLLQRVAVMAFYGGLGVECLSIWIFAPQVVQTDVEFLLLVFSFFAFLLRLMIPGGQKCSDLPSDSTSYLLLFPSHSRKTWPWNPGTPRREWEELICKSNCASLFMTCRSALVSRLALKGRRFHR